MSPQAVEAALRSGDRTIQVGQGPDSRRWSLQDGSTRVVALPDSNCPGDLGTAIWVLSHLTYPLAWVGDVYRVTQDGVDFREEMFLRTAGLVDVPDSCRNIVFLVPGQYRERVSLGGSTFSVGLTDRHGNADPHRPPILVNVDGVIETLVNSCLNSKFSLRGAFSRFTDTNFDRGLNWLEINTLVTARKVARSCRGIL